MVVARIWKRPPPALLYPGWVLLVIGGTICTILIFYMVLWPAWMEEPSVRKPALPKAREGAALVPPDESRPRIDLLPNGDVRESRASDRRPCIVHVHEDANWLAIRALLRRLRDEGHEEVRFALQTKSGAVTTIAFPLQDPWPDLDVHAGAQAFIDAIR